MASVAVSRDGKHLGEDTLQQLVLKAVHRWIRLKFHQAWLVFLGNFWRPAWSRYWAPCTGDRSGGQGFGSMLITILDFEEFQAMEAFIPSCRANTLLNFRPEISRIAIIAIPNWSLLGVFLS